MRTITLELLRHGPAHNQLLSPLTPYLALCENHGAVTFHVPFEHNQFLHRLSALGYKFGEESRVFQLNDTARVLGDLLGDIPGLTAESSKLANTEENLTHLRLIISASELALLPFELALSPNGLPGSGQHLLLQPQMPICLTREIRRVPGEQLKWPRKPRILFVAAAPPEVGQIPVESHLLTLRRQIEPWVKFIPKEKKEMARDRVDEHMVFLPNASIEEIEKQCASNTFTHIHILAHGIARQENYDTRFFLALHSVHDPYKTEYISGARLATALRPSQRPDSGGLAKPVVVTLASCDSGNVGSVAGAGASIAHALHESGIPMVVAGQFPLSFEGSVCLVDCLYEGLLWGTDPRRLLYDLRRRLYAQFQDKHDWASLTAYVSLPPDFDQQLSEVQIDQALGSINAAMNHADQATMPVFKIMHANLTAGAAPPAPTIGLDNNAEIAHSLESARERIDKAKHKLERLLTRLPGQKKRIMGLLASTEKRQAEILYSATRNAVAPPGNPIYNPNESLELLRKSRDYYWETFLLERSDSWALVQYLSLSVVLKNLRESDVNLSHLVVIAAEKEQHQKLMDLWLMAKRLSEFDTRKPETAVYAHSNLMELHLLYAGLATRQAHPQETAINPEQEMATAYQYAQDFLELADRNSFSVYSTRRQLQRYTTWFNEIANLGNLPVQAQELLTLFPEDVEDAWR